MEIAPGFAITHYADSSIPGGAGNSVLYGHDDIDGSIFRYLHNLQPGDLIYFDGAGRSTFRVTGKTVVTPDRVDILNDSSTARLTLFTCWPFLVDTHRLVVFAEPT
jgi:sortase A